MRTHVGMSSETDAPLTWSLSGFDSQGNRVSLRFTDKDFYDTNGLVIGRDSKACDLHVPDPTVSRKHARLVAHAGALWVEDLNSSNGTLLNGQRIREGGKQLPRNGELQIGSVILQIRAYDASPLSEDGHPMSSVKLSDRLREEAAVAQAVAQDRESTWLAWSTMVLAVLVALALYNTNPKESDLRAFLVKEMTIKIQQDNPPKNIFEALASGFVTAIAPVLLEQALLIRRQDYLLFSLYSIEMSPLANNMAQLSGVSGWDGKACLVGAFNRFFIYDCSRQ